MPDDPSGSSSLRCPAPLHVVLLQPEIAANTGAIGRTCVAAGAMLWLVRPLGFHLDDRYLRRAALDYWDHLEYKIVDGLDEVVAALGRDRLWSFSTRAARAYTDATYEPGDALVFGPESRGLPASLAGRAARPRRPHPDPPRGPQPEPGQRRGDRRLRGGPADRRPGPRSEGPARRMKAIGRPVAMAESTRTARHSPSNATLPATRVATRMIDGDDGDLVVIDPIDDGIGESTYEGKSQVLEDLTVRLGIR